MTNFGLDPGFSVVLIPTPALFAGALAFLMVGILLWMVAYLYFKRARRLISLSVVSQPQEARIAQEIYLDDSSAALIGPSWEWTADLEASYGCPSCGKHIPVMLRAYHHLPTGDGFLIARHTCVRDGQLDTIPVPTVAPWKRGDA